MCEHEKLACAVVMGVWSEDFYSGSLLQLWLMDVEGFSDGLVQSSAMIAVQSCHLKSRSVVVSVRY